MILLHLVYYCNLVELLINIFVGSFNNNVALWIVAKILFFLENIEAESPPLFLKKKRERHNE